MIFRNEEPGEPYRRWKRTNPDTHFFFYMWPLNVPRLVALSRDAKQHILNNANMYVRPDFERAIFKYFGDGLFTAEGAEHSRQRKLWSSPFSTTNLKKIRPIFSEKVTCLVDAIKQEFKSGSTGDIEIFEWLRRLTFDIIGSAGLSISSCSDIVFGYEFNSMCKTDDTHKKQFEALLKLANVRKFFNILCAVFPSLRRWRIFPSVREVCAAYDSIRELITMVV